MSTTLTIGGSITDGIMAGTTSSDNNASNQRSTRPKGAVSTSAADRQRQLDEQHGATPRGKSGSQAHSQVALVEGEDDFEGFSAGLGPGTSFGTTRNPNTQQPPNQKKKLEGGNQSQLTLPNGLFDTSAVTQIASAVAAAVLSKHFGGGGGGGGDNGGGGGGGNGGDDDHEGSQDDEIFYPGGNRREAPTSRNPYVKRSHEIKEMLEEYFNIGLDDGLLHSSKVLSFSLNIVLYMIRQVLCGRMDPTVYMYPTGVPNHTTIALFQIFIKKFWQEAPEHVLHDLTQAFTRIVSLVYAVGQRIFPKDEYILWLFVEPCKDYDNALQPVLEHYASDAGGTKAGKVFISSSKLKGTGLATFLQPGITAAQRAITNSSRNDDKTEKGEKKTHKKCRECDELIKHGSFKEHNKVCKKKKK